MITIDLNYSPAEAGWYAELIESETGRTIFTTPPAVDRREARTTALRLREAFLRDGKAALRAFAKIHPQQQQQQQTKSK